MFEKIKIGTRGSKLAMWQAEYVADRIKKAGFEPEIIIIETKGDQILDRSLSKIGSKGVFTEDIEAKLIAGEIDIAVHSAKDMPSQLPHGLEILSFTEREKVNDVLVSHKPGVSLKTENLIIGTSSTRRIAMLKYYFPNVKTVDMRGNLQTRIRKMEEGQCDAMLLAYAGVHRMNYDTLIAEIIPETVFTPAVGQGSVAIEISSDLSLEKRTRIKSCTNHSITERCLLAERAFLRRMEGGCSVPVFCLAQLDGSEITMEGGIVSLNGQQMVRKSVSSEGDPVALGMTLADLVLNDNGAGILKEIKTQLKS